MRSTQELDLWRNRRKADVRQRGLCLSFPFLKDFPDQQRGKSQEFIYLTRRTIEKQVGQVSALKTISEDSANLLLIYNIINFPRTILEAAKVQEITQEYTKKTLFTFSTQGTGFSRCFLSFDDFWPEPGVFFDVGNFPPFKKACISAKTKNYWNQLLAVNLWAFDFARHSTPERPRSAFSTGQVTGPLWHDF